MKMKPRSPLFIVLAAGLVGSAGVVLAYASPSASDSVAVSANANIAQAPSAQKEGQGGFTYSYPADLTKRAPALAAQLEKEKAAAKTSYDKMVADYGDGGGSASAGMLSSSTKWRVESEDDHLIVLLAEYGDYQGGAHGMHATLSKLWDKKANKEIAFLDMFSDPAAAKVTMMPSYCAMLDAERFGLRGKATDKTDTFGDCPDPFEGTVYPDNLNGTQYLRIGISLPPYTAGPYSEGQYDLSIAAPTYITDLLKPEYKDIFQTYG